MVMQASLLPRVARTDVGAILVSEWTVETPERQRATVEAFRSIWESVLWPVGLLSVNLFSSTDGSTIMNYAQWTSEGAYQAFTRSHLRSRLVEEIDRLIPGIERKPPIQYRMYRGNSRENPPPTGCVVMVSVEFEGPDEQRQRRWIDTVFDAIHDETELPPGGISGYFHTSIDGTRVLNYAEWIDEESHRWAIERSGQGTIGRNPKWLEVRNFPGVRSSGFNRYQLAASYSDSRGGS